MNLLEESMDSDQPELEVRVWYPKNDYKTTDAYMWLKQEQVCCSPDVAQIQPINDFVHLKNQRLVLMIN